MPNNATTRTERVGFAELLIQARITNRLLAAQLKATLGQQQLVRLLATTGASAADIADVLNTTSGTVSTTLQRLKRKGVSKAEPVEAESSSPAPD